MSSSLGIIETSIVQLLSPLRTRGCVVFLQSQTVSAQKTPAKPETNWPDDELALALLLLPQGNFARKILIFRVSCSSKFKRQACG